MLMKALYNNEIIEYVSLRNNLVKDKTAREAV